MLEETSVSMNITENNLIKITSTKGRDPRGWVISVAYKILCDEATVKPVANSDAIYASWVDVDSLTQDHLAFDHYDIIKYALEKE